MKKLVLFVAVLVAVSFASCKKAAPAPACVEEEVAIEEVAAACGDSLVVEEVEVAAEEVAAE